MGPDTSERTMPLWLRACRILFALLDVVTVGYRLASGLVRGPFDVGNFFSLFTTESNLFTALVLLGTALVGGAPSPRRDLFRGAAVAYMATTGIVYGILLGNHTATPGAPVPWDNTVLHRLIPLAVVADWLLAPPGRGLTHRRALVWMAYPLAYLAYSLVCGALVGWYPYYFLDPARADGYGGVARYVVGIALGFLLFVWLSVTLGRRVHLRVTARG
jgi:hypothetical protein